MSAFQVDLRGVVDLLSHHLYSSPRVFVRELLQNGVDAIAARSVLAPDAPAGIQVVLPSRSGDGTLRVRDTGIGLTAAEMTELLATIGHSSKRGADGFSRAGFLGQFGIGLLSCFLVADEIVVRSRSAREPRAVTVCWRGRGEGTYEVWEDVSPLGEPGTEVVLVPRPDEASWFADQTVSDLVSLFGSLLPVTIEVLGADGSTVIGASTPPWAWTREFAAEYCEQTFGFTPFEVVPLEVDVSGVRGVAFVMPTAANPTVPAFQRVYLRGMLLAEATQGLLPDWAIFTRCVLDCRDLRPTASREALLEDDLLDITRQQLGQQLRSWLLGLARSDPAKLQEFFAIHNVAVRAVALHDDEMLRLAHEYLPFETTIGTMPIARFRQTHSRLRYARTQDDFRGLASVAAAQGFGLVSASAVYSEAILQRLAERDSSLDVARTAASPASG